jgi:hypothetical protein
VHRNIAAHCFGLRADRECEVSLANIRHEISALTVASTTGTGFALLKSNLNTLI